MEDKNLKVINLVQDFGCCKLEHLQTIFDRKKDNFKDILSKNLINKKGDIFVWNNCKIDIKMLASLDVLCKYKGRYKYFYKGIGINYITFLDSYDTLYKIIVSDKQNETGLLKQLKISDPNIDADKLILLFEDDANIHNIVSDKPYLYCIYPNIKIISK